MGGVLYMKITGLILVLLFMVGCDNTTSVKNYSGRINLFNNTEYEIVGFIDNEYFEILQYKTHQHIVSLDSEDDIKSVELNYRLKNDYQYVSETINVPYEVVTPVTVKSRIPSLTMLPL